jgi:hypothetical protein
LNGYTKILCLGLMPGQAEWFINARINGSRIIRFRNTRRLLVAGMTLSNRYLIQQSIGSAMGRFTFRDLHFSVSSFGSG